MRPDQSCLGKFIPPVSRTSLFRFLQIATLYLAAGDLQEAKASAEDAGCDVTAAASSLIVPNTNSVKALVVFARFVDENRRTWEPNSWPIDTLATRRDVLPSWADSLVENVSSPNTPQVEGSLTHYFHYMSRGTMRFKGDVYDSVIVLPSISNFTGSGMIGAMGAVMDSLAAACFDFSSFMRASDQSEHLFRSNLNAHFGQSEH